MSRSAHPIPRRRALVALVVAVLAAFWAVPAAVAGGAPPRPDDFAVEATYINCVDDEVDAPGIDGGAIVRFRITNDGAQDVTVTSGSWRLAVAGFTVAEGSFSTPAPLPVGATWEQVLHVPGGTGPAELSASADVTGTFGTTALTLDPVLDVPGDCPQPEKPTEPTPPPTTDPRPAVDRGVVVRPRFTG